MEDHQKNMMRNKSPNPSVASRQKARHEVNDEAYPGSGDFASGEPNSPFESGDAEEGRTSSHDFSQDKALAAEALAELSRDSVTESRKIDASESETERWKHLASKEEKRLERNRVKARIARKRKKVMLTGLEHKINAVSKENATLQEENSQLRKRLGDLTKECARFGWKEQKCGALDEEVCEEAVTSQVSKKRSGPLDTDSMLPVSSIARLVAGSDQVPTGLFSNGLALSQAQGSVARPGMRNDGAMMLPLPLEARSCVNPMLLDMSGRGYVQMRTLDDQNLSGQRGDTSHSGATMGRPRVYFQPHS